METLDCYSLLYLSAVFNTVDQLILLESLIDFKE